MTLANRLEKANPIPKITFRGWYNQLAAVDRDALDQAGRDPRWTNAAILRAIREEGGVATPASIAAWRDNLR